MSIFREKIRASLADANLQVALDANAQRRVDGRVAAFKSLPDHQERRQRAHRIREDIIANLDDVVAQFLTKVEENSIIIHRAKDADEAIKIALKIAEDSPQRTQRNSKGEKTWRSSRLGGSKKLIAKSKSMVTEEIGLNKAFEAAGHRVVETDLGEYIVQLRDEKPSHIITPAVHLRRQDVAQLFHEELDIPYTEDIPALTEVARETLRQIFLDADIGISGVNFGVAESGSLCIVTNEGNGRMVTTLPRTHIAVMGMERLVPTMDDLALMLSLLPRSATTQIISVYTQFIQRPLEGQQRHLILLDNGRAALRGSPLNDGLMCIRCGACLNACPIFREIGGHAYVGADGAETAYPGPIGSVISPGLFGSNFAPLSQACSVCGACKEACPVDIDLPKMLLRVRSGQATADGGRSGEGLPLLVKLGLNAYRRVALHPNLFGISQKWIGRLASTVKANFIPLPAWTGWGYSKDFPRPVAKPFRERWKSRNQGLGNQVTRKKVSGDRQNESKPIPTIPNSQLPIPDSLTSRFSQELTALGGKIISSSAAELSEKLSVYLHERGATCVQADAASMVYVQSQGIAVQTEADSNIAVGITATVAAVAETGSILVLGEERDPLATSLLPEVHIAILQTSDIYQSLEEVLSLPQLTESSTASLISGPSRTADIEMTLTIGVHGPRELIVFLVDD